MDGYSSRLEWPLKHNGKNEDMNRFLSQTFHRYPNYQRNGMNRIENRSRDSNTTSFPIFLLDQTCEKASRIIRFHKKSDKEEKEKDSLHNASRMLIILARCFGLFPVLGVSSASAKGLYFRWASRPMFFSLLILGYAFLVEALTVLRTIQTGLTYYSTVDFVFLASLICIYLLFIQLANKWPVFVNEWEEVEKHACFPGYSKNLFKKFMTLTVTIMILAIIEHLSAIVTKVVEALQCVNEETDLMKAYFINTYKHIFTFVHYNIAVASVVTILNLIMSCAWNFVDIFIILMSVAMTERYKTYNQVLQSARRKIMSPIFWRNMREEYNQLSYLTKKLDDLLSPIVLLSFANNLYFICLQLFNSLKPMASTWHVVYFVYSFSYLLLRTIAVSLYAASIFDQSKQPKEVLFSVPPESYSTEVARLITQVTSDELALTGCRFFSVTRTLVLTVAGTIVTYEIVLVQFNAVNSESKKNMAVICM